MKNKTPLLFAILFLFAACTGSSGDASASADSSSQKTAVVKSAPVADAKFMQSVQQYRSVIPQSVSADFVFYTDFGSASSGVQEAAQMRQFMGFITGNPASNPNKCAFDGASVVYDDDGNILCEMDFVLKKGCEHVRLRMNNEYTLHEFTPQGIAYFQQFMDIIVNMNNPNGSG